MLTNKKVVLIVPALILLLLAAKNVSIKSSPTAQSSTPSPSSSPQSRDALIISTNPPNLDGSTIAPTQEVSLTFNYPIQNKDEFRSSITPTIDYTIELSDDRKTVTLTPKKPYGFNQGYTFHISALTKFDGGKKMPTDKDINFRTVDYSGV